MTAPREDVPTLRSDALVGITLNQLCDLSYLIGMTRPTPGLLVSTKRWDDAMAVLHEALERGEVVVHSGSSASPQGRAT